LSPNVFTFTIAVRAADEASAWRRLRQAVSLETDEELGRRVHVEEVVGWLYPDELVEPSAQEIAERIRMPDPSGRSWRRWISKMRRGRRVRRRLAVAA
jgi:hypothetical protein